MSSRLPALPPTSPFVKNRSTETTEYAQDRPTRDPPRRPFNAHRNGYEQARSKTATKGFVSTPDVEEDMHRSVIEELQCLDAPPTKTEHLINTKHTFEELHIRKSSSFDRDRVELSLSSDYIDFQSENTQLRRKIEELERQVRELGEAEQKAKVEAQEYKERLKQSQERLQNAESQCSRARLLITEYENEIAVKEDLVAQLQLKLDKTSRAIREQDQLNKASGVDIQALKNHFQNEKQSIIQAYEQHLANLQERAQEQIQALLQEFNSAKAVGQQQIDTLLRTLQKQESENAFLRNTINQGLFRKNSTHISQELSQSKAQQCHPCTEPHHPQQHNYMARFRNFSKMIDRKLFSSCDERESNIFYSKVATNSAIERGKLNGKFEHLGKLGEGKNRIIHHQHHLSAR